MISCPKCSKENQDHYKFCLGCGAELPRDAAPKAFSPQTPPQGMRAVQPAAIAHAPVPSAAVAAAAAAPYAAPAPRPASIPRPAPAPAPVAAPVLAPTPASAPPPAPPVAAPAAASAPCPQCGQANVAGIKFCASCGYNLSAAASVAAVAAAAAPVAAPAAPPAAATIGITLTALRADGSDAGTFQLPSATTTVGRDLGSIFAGDSYLSPHHATLSVRGGQLFVKDEGSLNGVYLKLTPDQPVELPDGAIFRIGQEIIRFEALRPAQPGPDGVELLGSPSAGYIGRVSLLTGRDSTGNSFPVPEQGLHIGRERGEIVFPEDGYVSGLHCRISYEGGKVWLTDVGSSNGTFIRLLAEREVRGHDVLLMGQQLFRIDM